jgi:hypothetical protein
MRSEADWLSDPALFTTSAVVLLADKFGTEFLEWDPITVSMEVRSAFGVELTTEIQDRIQAASSLFTSNLFFVSLEAFSTICNALNFGSVASEIFVPADLDDVLWGVTEAKILLGDMYDPEGYSHNVSRFVGYLLSEDGVTTPPSSLSFAEYDEIEEENLSSEFERDIEFQQAYTADQIQERQNLEKVNIVKIMALFEQLQKLPVKHGSTEFIREVMSKLSAA